MAKVKPVTGDRKARLKDMLSSRNPVERDSAPMMNAMNKARVKGAKSKAVVC